MSDTPGDSILEELAGIGDERQVTEAVERYRSAGATLPVVGPIGNHEGSAGFEKTLEAVAA